MSFTFPTKSRNGVGTKMYRNRKEVRETPKKIRVSEYDIERLEALLDQIGGQEATRMYELFLRGLEQAEAEIELEKTA